MDALALHPDKDFHPPTAARRTLHRPHALPGRRAFAGAVLVTVAIVGLFAMFARAESSTGVPVIVAAHDLPAGTRLSSGDLRVITVRVPAETRSHVFRSTDELSGRVLTGRINAGEMIQRSSVIRGGEQPPFRELTVLVDSEQLQAVEEGDTVDVLVTTGTGVTARTDVAAGGARILRIARRSSSLGSEGRTGVTFAVGSFDDITRVVQAAHAGSLTLVRSTGFAAQPSTYDPARPDANR